MAFILLSIEDKKLVISKGLEYIQGNMDKVEKLINTGITSHKAPSDLFNPECWTVENWNWFNTLLLAILK